LREFAELGTDFM